MVDVRVRGVFERDIDLLLLEEFVSSPEFLRWFFGKVGLATSGQLLAAARSVATSNGETDLELTVVDDDCVTKLLLEDKVDANLQPRQPERYAERGDAYRQRRACDKFLTVLIAPEEYARTVQGFEQKVTYESILQWFESQGESERMCFKRLVLREAIERGSAGWTLVEHPAATDFWQRYWEIATSTGCRNRDPNLPPRALSNSGRSAFRVVSSSFTRFPMGMWIFSSVAWLRVPTSSREGSQRIWRPACGSSARASRSSSEFRFPRSSFRSLSGLQ